MRRDRNREGGRARRWRRISAIAEYAFHTANLGRQSLRRCANGMSSMLGRRTPYPEGLDEQWRKVLSASGRLRRTLGPGEDPPVLFMPVWGADTAVTTRALETVLAHSVRLRGVRVVTAYCHGALPACLIDPLGNHFPPIPDRFALTGLTAATCRYCSSSLERLYGSGPLELVALTSYVQPKDLVDARTIAQSVPADRRCDFVYEDVHVGEHAMASTLRATGRGTLLRDELHEWLLTRQLMGSIAVVRATERLLAEVTPRRVVITHGIYVDHGTIAETARKRGVPVVVFVRPYRRNTVLLCHGDTYHRALLSEPSALWEDRVLSDGERSQLADYVESKRRGALDNVTYHPRPIEGIEAVRRELQLDSARPLVSLFTNVMWDAQIYHATSAFA